MVHSVKNNFETTLALDITDTQTTMQLNADPALPYPYWLTIGNDPATSEIVEVTGKTGSDFNIVRAQQGTTAQAWVAGTKVRMFMTAGHLQEVQTRINIETLTADKTLTKTDVMYQYLNPNNANRSVYLPTNAEAGKVFVIRNTASVSASYYLSVQQSTTVIDNIFAGGTKAFVFDGTNWQGADAASGSFSDAKYSTAVGYNAVGSSSGAAVGYNASGSGSGAAVGYNANGSNSGVAVGYNASANRKNYAVAKGFCSKAERWNEEVKSSDGAAATKYSYSTLAWHGETTNGTQIELYLGGTTNQRVLVLANSAFGFSLYATASNNADGKAKRWKIEGLIKRDGANNTALVGNVVKTVITQSDTGGVGTDNWDIIVTADDVNEALKVEVKGEDTKTIRWIIRGEIEEVRF